MDISRYYIEITNHAFMRQFERGITPDMVEATIKGGKIKRFGKKGIRFVMRYSGFTVICIGEICGMKIKILTVEKGERE